MKDSVTKALVPVPHETNCFLKRYENLRNDNPEVFLVLEQALVERVWGYVGRSCSCPFLSSRKFLDHFATLPKIRTAGQAVKTFWGNVQSCTILMESLWLPKKEHKWFTAIELWTDAPQTSCEEHRAILCVWHDTIPFSGNTDYAPLHSTSAANMDYIAKYSLRTSLSSWWIGWDSVHVSCNKILVSIPHRWCGWEFSTAVYFQVGPKRYCKPSGLLFRIFQ